jgi:hypothetical protein
MYPLALNVPDVEVPGIVDSCADADCYIELLTIDNAAVKSSVPNSDAVIFLLIGNVFILISSIVVESNIN